MTRYTPIVVAVADDDLALLREAAAPAIAALNVAEEFAGFFAGSSMTAEMLVLGQMLSRAVRP